MGFQQGPSPLFLTLPLKLGRNINQTQLTNTKVKVLSEKYLGEDITNLLAQRNVRNAYATIVQPFFDEVSINLNMFSSYHVEPIMLNWIVANINGCLVITK